MIRRELRRHRPEMVISAGFAGSLTPELAQGDIVLATNLSTHSVLDRLPINGIRPFILRSSAKLIDSPEDRTAFRDATGADAVDMESESIETECRAEGIPFLAIRVISDSLERPLPVPPEVLFGASESAAGQCRLAAFLLRHPEKIGSFAQFASGTMRGRRRLAAVLAQVVDAS
jgi:adenosylhomocysteine nucleosidase